MPESLIGLFSLNPRSLHAYIMNMIIMMTVMIIISIDIVMIVLMMIMMFAMIMMMMITSSYQYAINGQHGEKSL